MEMKSRGHFTVITWPDCQWQTACLSSLGDKSLQDWFSLHQLVRVSFLYLCLFVFETQMAALIFRCAVDMRLKNSTESLALLSGKSLACYSQSTETLFLPKQFHASYMWEYLQICNHEIMLVWSPSAPCQCAFPLFADIPGRKLEATLWFGLMFLRLWFNFLEKKIEVLIRHINRKPKSAELLGPFQTAY